MTPPAANPIVYAALKRKHWRNPQEITPGNWLVEEGSGPRASARRLAIVSFQSGQYGGWRYRGHCDTRGSSYATLELWLDNWSWKINGPADKLVPMLTDLVREHA